MKQPKRTATFLNVEQTADALEVSESTVWRLLRSGELPSVRRSGRRVVSSTEVERRVRIKEPPLRLRPFTKDHPLWKLIGAYKSGGQGPGSRDKYAVLFGEK